MQFRDTEFWVLTPARGAGPQINVTAEGKRATMQVLVRGTPSLIRRAQIDFLGTSRVLTAGNGTRYYSRTRPFYLPGYLRDDPGHEGLPYLWCVGVGVNDHLSPDENEEYADGFHLPGYKFARLTLSFSNLKYKLREDTDPQTYGTAAWSNLPDESTLERYVQPQKKEIIRTISAPQGVFKWVPEGAEAGGVPAAFRVPINEGGQEVVYTQMQVPEYPARRIEVGLGTVNAQTFAEYAPETLLCLAPEVEKIEQADGRVAYNIGWKFLYLPKLARENGPAIIKGVTPRGHNAYLRYLVGDRLLDYRRLSSDGLATGTQSYGTSNFRDLFRPDPA